jgi:hypothetical protein
MTKTIKETNNKMKYFKNYGMHKWKEVTIPVLKKGDKFRVYSNIGQPFELEGQETFIAISDSYKIMDHWAIDVEL